MKGTKEVTRYAGNCVIPKPAKIIKIDRTSPEEIPETSSQDILESNHGIHCANRLQNLIKRECQLACCLWRNKPTLLTHNIQEGSVICWKDT